MSAAANEERTETQVEAGENVAEEVIETADPETDSLPEWARKQLTKANAEAASYRTQLREAQDRLGSAKTIEDFEAARLESEKALAAKDREIVALKYKLPSRLASRLQGNSLDELEADAKELAAELAPAARNAPRPTGGLTPTTSGQAERFDPRALADEVVAAQRNLF